MSIVLNNGTTLATDVPPTRELADTIEMFYLMAIICVGTPLNLYVFCRLAAVVVLNHRACGNFVLIKLHLNVTDISILLVHALGKAIWLLVYQWPLGRVACKTYKFLTAFTYYSSSNVIVCIGIDRLKTVFTNRRRVAGRHASTNYMLALAWLLAAACAAPQFWAWTVMQPYENWTQCVDVWTTMNASDGQFSGLQVAHELNHLFFVFWGPFFVILVIYLLIAVRLCAYSLRPIGEKEVGTSGNRLDIPLQMLTNLKKSASSNAHGKLTADHSPMLYSPSYHSSPQRVRTRSASTSTNDMAVTPQHHRNAAQNMDGHWEDHQREQLQEERMLLRDVSTIRKEIAKSREQNTKLGRKQTREQSTTSSLKQVSIPAWRKQLRSKVFLTTLAVVSAHIALWLPYNLLSVAKYVDIDHYNQLLQLPVVRILENLIVLTSLINPVLYGFH